MLNMTGKTRVHGIDDAHAAQYVGAVSAALDAAGYGPTEMFSEYVALAANPDYVVRATLAGGTVADLVWDTLSWTLIVYPGGGSNVHDDVLTGPLTIDSDARPQTLVKLARPKLAEAARRWSGCGDHGVRGCVLCYPGPRRAVAPAPAAAVGHDHNPLLPCHSRCPGWGSAGRGQTERARELTSIIATVDLGGVPRERVEAAVRDALTRINAQLVPCGWAPDPDTIADMTDADRVTVLDLNPNRTADVPAPAEPDVEVVTLRWSARHGRCYECNLPAAFWLPRAYRTEGEPDDVVREETLRCAVCAANAAVNGDGPVRRIDDETDAAAPAGGDRSDRPREIRHPKYGYTETAHTLDGVIARLHELRREHGGDVVVGCVKDSSDSAHLLDGETVADYCAAEDAWGAGYTHRGPAILFSIND